MKPLVLIIALWGPLILPALAEKQAFDRYQSIVDRQMFGPLPPDFDPTKSPNEVQKSSSASEKELSREQEQLKSAVHFSVLDVRPNGDVLVGFTDNSDPKVPRNYFLKVGETRDGWTVKEADRDAATMTIEKNDIEVSLTLGGNSAKGAGTTARSGAAADAGGAMGRRPSLLGGGGSLRSLRNKRQQAFQAEQAQLAAEKEAQAAKEAERQREAEAEKAQREAEKAEQRQQLMAIQEELKRAREARAAAEAQKSEAEKTTESNGGAEN